MQAILFIGMAFVMGIIMSVYLPMNSAVARYIGSTITANVTFFLVAFLASLIIFIFFGQFDTLHKTRDVPIYLFLTGIISAFIVLGTTFLIPHIGARKFFIILIAGQIVMAIIISHFGILESPKDPINVKKIFGASIVILGAIISIS